MFSATGLELKTALKLANFELGSVDADSYIHIKWEQIKLIFSFNFKQLSHKTGVLRTLTSYLSMKVEHEETEG